MIFDLDDLFLAVSISAAALLYSSVGHGGASGYLAVMALAGLAPEVMKPAALLLNIFVSTIAMARFYRAGSFSWDIFWPFALTSVPFAFLGGTMSLPGHVYKQIVGIVLVISAYLLFRYTQRETHVDDKKKIRTPTALSIGAGIGLLSGMTGVGGGIFLSPLLLFFRWAGPRESAGISSAFILVNSAAGILGHGSRMSILPDAVSLWAPAAVAGGILGSWLGSRKFSNMTIRRLLAVVLAFAGIKFILGG